MHMMTLPATTVLPDLRVSNDLLSDRAALDAEWNRSGYWYFRNVIPIDALQEFRAHVLAALKSIGVVDHAETDAIWNGRPLDRFPEANMAGYGALPGLERSRRWMDFLATPSVAAFFETALGAPADWVAVAEQRVTPPGEDISGGLFSYPHQDGFYNEGYRCLTAWMPLWSVSKATGGLAVAEGLHHNNYYHDKTQPLPYPIPPGAIPDEAWRTADYRLGDVVLFDRFLPHSGQRNRSEKNFRVSFDVRCILPGDPVPLFGTMISSTSDMIEFSDLEGKTHKLRMTGETQIRGTARSRANQIDRLSVPTDYPEGQEVLVTYDGDCAVMLREPKY